MGIFDGIESAKMSMGGNYERAGHYLALIRRVKLDVSRKKVEFVAVEKVILQVIAAEPGTEPHSVGDQVSHLMMSDKDSFLGNFKSMIANVLGANPAEITAEVAQTVVDEEQQPLAGLVVEMQNRTITTKKGDPFTLVTYVRALDPDEVVERVGEETLRKVLLKEEAEELLSAAREG
jgi:hypothetical protein